MGIFSRLASAVLPQSVKEEIIRIDLQLLMRDPSWTRTDYGQLSKEGYEKCVIAYRCIHEVAYNLASVPWWVFDSSDPENRKPLDKHPLMKLLNRPNPWEAWSAFAYKWAAHLQIGGNAYMEGNPLSTGEVSELYVKRPDRMKVLPGVFGPKGYEYTINGQTTSYQVDEAGRCPIRHWKMFHPTDDWYGLSPIAVAARDVDMHNGYGTWNFKLLQNEARPSGVITLPAALNVSSDQRKALKQKMKEEHEGKDNAGRTLILDAGATWAQYGFSPKDMEWISGRNVTARDIASAFNVPPILLNIGGDTTFSNMQEARIWLWDTTIMFFLSTLRDELNAWLVAPWAKRESRPLYLDFDLSDSPVARLKKDQAWDRAMKSGEFLTINERRKLIGYGDTEGGNVVLIGVGQMPLQDAGAADADAKNDSEKGLSREEWEDEAARLAAEREGIKGSAG